MKNIDMEKPTLISIVGKSRVKCIGTFFQSLFNALEDNKRVLLIKFNHSNTYQHFITMATLLQKSKELVDSFQLTEIEIYEQNNLKAVSIIKQFHENFDQIFIEKADCVNDYSFLDELRNLTKTLKKDITMLPQNNDNLDIQKLKEHNDITYFVIDNEIISDLFKIEFYFPKTKKLEVASYKIDNHCLVYCIEDECKFGVNV